MNPTQNNNGYGAGNGPHAPRYKMTASSMKHVPHGHRGAKLSASRTVKRTFPEGTPEKVTLRDRFNGWRLGISVDSEDIFKGVVIGLILIMLTILQTTLFTRFRPFGVVPDLILPFVIAVAALEKEKWGSVVALIAAYVIDAAGGTTVMLLPLLYVPAAIMVGLLTTHRLRDSFPVAVVYTVVTSVLRGAITFLIVMLTVHKITPAEALTHIVIPELFANMAVAFFPQLMTRICLRPFHKTRAERTGKV